MNQVQQLMGQVWGGSLLSLEGRGQQTLLGIQTERRIRAGGEEASIAAVHREYKEAMDALMEYRMALVAGRV